MRVEMIHFISTNAILKADRHFLIDLSYQYRRQSRVVVAASCWQMIITNPWTLWAATLKWWANRCRKRDVSSIVPDAMTRCLGRPLSFHVTQAMMSHGLVTTTTTASGLYLTSSGMMLLKIPTFFCTRSRRDSSSFWRAPAVMMITQESCSHHNNAHIAPCCNSEN